MKTFIFRISALCIMLAVLGRTSAQTKLDSIMPVRGFCIQVPMPKDLVEFIKFVNEELAPRNVNTLILRVDYNYQYESHPELRDDVALTKAEVKKLVDVCKKHNISIIPQINLLGHQSWELEVSKLLKVYPEFDETPNVKIPAKYEWPNSDGLYCKSYCPLHPKVHEIVFAMMDELCDVFEAPGFHAGMDEVFYIGMDSCKRCCGRDKAELFAGEVRTVRDHLSKKGRTLWIWGDRLLEGKITGLGEWEASYNNTHRAIDMIPKDVMICDWHYERPEQTAVYFAMKGLNVATCPWNRPGVATAQVEDMIRFRKNSTPEMSERFKGMIQTVWSPADQFLDEFYGRKQKKNNAKENTDTQANCFRAMYDALDNAVKIK